MRTLHSKAKNRLEDENDRKRIWMVSERPADFKRTKRNQGGVGFFFATINASTRTNFTRPGS